MDSKTYRFLTRKEASELAEAGAHVEWTYNIDRFSVRGRMHEWRRWEGDLGLYHTVDGYDDQFRVEAE